MCYTFNIIPESVYGLHYDEIQANIEVNQKNKILEHFCSKNSGERLIVEKCRIEDIFCFLSVFNQIFFKVFVMTRANC